MAEIEPFEVSVRQDVLDDLARRLEHARFPRDIANDNWSYGVNAAYLKELVEYWRSSFDWRAQERAINSFSHYRTEIDGIPINFIREPGKGPNPIPIVLSHGWPWTFWDMKDVIRPLADPASYGGDPADAFEVIVPSLPGYGFSTPLTKPGVNFWVTADIWKKLMVDWLGFERFGAQGGDWGTLITVCLAHKYPEHVIGMHSTMVAEPSLFNTQRPWDPTGGMLLPDDLPPEEFARLQAWQRRLVGHTTVHMTEPQTLSYGLHDSPVGLLAWLLKGRYAWADVRGDVESRFSKDFLLTTAMIYWVTESFVNTARYYAEAGRNPWQRTHPGKIVQVPAGISLMPRDGAYGLYDDDYANSIFENIVYQVKNEEGGHFVPSEVPETFVHDLRATFRSLR